MGDWTSIRWETEKDAESIPVFLNTLLFVLENAAMFSGPLEIDFLKTE